MRSYKLKSVLCFFGSMNNTTIKKEFKKIRRKCKKRKNEKRKEYEKKVKNKKNKQKINIA